MDENARIDYFRSEIRGEMDRLGKRMAEQLTENLRLLREFEKRLDKLTSEMKSLEMSER